MTNRRRGFVLADENRKPHIHLDGGTWDYCACSHAFLPRTWTYDEKARAYIAARNDRERRPQPVYVRTN